MCYVLLCGEALQQEYYLGVDAYWLSGIHSSKMNLFIVEKSCSLKCNGVFIDEHLDWGEICCLSCPFHNNAAPSRRHGFCDVG